MNIRYLITSLILAGFILTISPPGMAQTNIEVKGSILRIEDKTVVIKSDQGKNVIIKLEDSQGLKVGEKVEVKDGFLRTFDSKTGQVKERKKLPAERPT